MKRKALLFGALTVIWTTIAFSQTHKLQVQSPQTQTVQAQDPQPPLSEGYPQYRVPSDEEIQLLQKDIRLKRKQIIAANMDLTEAESEKFWPVYEQYNAELSAVNDAKISLLKEYVLTYSALTDQQAESYVHRWAALDESTNQLRAKYFPIFHQVLSGKSTALFFQLDHRLALMIDLQLTSQIPIIEP